MPRGSLVRRVLYGFLNREGCRKEEAAPLLWTDVTLDDMEDGLINLDENKTKDPRAWALNPSTAEALRRWRRAAPASKWIFGVEGGPKTNPHPVYVDQLARQLRKDLTLAGVTRHALFEHSAKRQQLRAHDLRATFITISLANGRSEAWVQDRTGHKSSIMINTYRRKARTHAETRLGDLVPMHLAIPELAEVEPDHDAEGEDESSVESSVGVTLLKFG